jgi:hypothetical protein
MHIVGLLADGRSGLTVKLKHSASGGLIRDNTVTGEASSKLHTQPQLQPHREHSLCAAKRPIFQWYSGDIFGFCVRTT